MATLDATTRTQLVELYVAYFNRAPDANGLNYWAGKIANDGWTVATVARSFMDQTEVASAYPAYMTNAEVVNKVYANVLNRAPDAEGATYWTNQLNSGAVSKADLIMAVVNAAKSSTGTAADAAVVANKTAVGEYFAVTKGLNDTTAAATVMAGVTSDAATVATANAAIDNFATTGSTTATGTTYTLLATADTVPGTAGNDTVIATEATLSSADRITGGNGSDELKLSSRTATNYSAFEMNGVETVTVTADNSTAQTFDMSGATGVTLLKTLNSTGNVVFNQVTEVSNVEVNNLTTGANVTVSFQDAAVSGTANTVALALANNTNTGVGTITLGRTANANSGIETVAITTSGAASTVAQLDTNASTISVAGNQNLTVTAALNNTVDTVAAGSFTGALNISLVGNVAAAGEGALSVTTGTGADTVNMTGITRNATVTMGEGNDVLQAGLGDDTIDMGAGDDRIDLAANGLTVNDTITGGTGSDTIRVTAADYINLTEAMRVSAVETADLRAAGSTLVVSNTLVDTATGGFTVTTQNATGGHTVDLTNVTSIANFRYVAENDLTDTANSNIATNDTVIVTENQINSTGSFAFGAGNTDTLRVMDGARLTTDDFANVTGLDNVEFRSNSNAAQNFQIDLSDAILRQASQNNNDATDGSAAVLATANLVAGGFTITIDSSVNPGSTVTVDLSAITAAQAARMVAGSINVVNGAGVTVTYIYGNVAAAAINETVPADAGRTLTATGTSANTTSGFEIQNNLMAGSGDDNIVIGGLTMIAGSVLNGSANPIGGNGDTLTATTGANIAAATVANIENLSFSGAITMTAAQHNGFTAINGTTGADTINLTGAVGVNVAGDADVETYAVNSAAGAFNFTVGSLTQSVTESGTNATIVLGTAGAYTGTYTSVERLSLTANTDITGATGITGSLTNVNIANNTQHTMTAAQYTSIESIADNDASSVTGMGGTETITLTTSAAIDAMIDGGTGNFIESYVLNGSGADTLTISETLDTDLVDAVRGAMSVDLAGGGADTIVIDNAAVNNAVDSSVNITNFSMADDKLQLSVGGVAVSNGTFYNNSNGVVAAAATGDIIEINSASFQYGVATNTAAVLAFLSGAGLAGAAGGEIVTVVAYNGAGQAAIYQLEETNVAAGAFDTIELIGTVNATDNAFTGSNFA